MVFETEIKIILKDKDHFEKILNLCKKKFKTEGIKVKQRDEYYDTENELLKMQDFTIRLRTINGRTLLAMKGPRMFIDDKIHKRIELEFYVSNTGKIHSELKAQSLKATTIIEKIRWTFHFQNATISIDKLPFIGCFIEIEGPYNIIKQIMSILKLKEKNAVIDNYTELFEKKFQEIKLSCRPNLKATFDIEKKWVETNE